MTSEDRKAGGRHVSVNGLLLLDKPAGMTSNAALQKVRRMLGARKAGHTGSLDPAATGMLPLCFGEATKVCAFLLEADKTYRVTARLGTATDSGDATGNEIARADVPELDRQGWRAILGRFMGETEQVPPMYSALKKDGKRLYELARRGETVEREPRAIRIDAIDLLEAAGNRLVLRVRCSKGTYIRTLVEDIARAAGTLAHTAALHRESVADFDAASMRDMESIRAAAEADVDALRASLLPADRALTALPAVSVTGAESGAFANGMAVAGPAETDPGLVRVYAANDGFVGVGELSADGRLAPRRVFRSHVIS